MVGLQPFVSAGVAEVLVLTSFQNTVSTGSLVITALLALGTIVAAIFGVKWKATAQAGASTIELWQNNAAGEKLRADQADAERLKLTTECAELRAKVTEFEKQPKLQALEAIMLHHEERAEDRSKRQIAVLERIDAKLPPPA